MQNRYMFRRMNSSLKNHTMVKIPDRPGRKEVGKILLMDGQTAARLTRAADLLGLPATSFVQLALHRAFEQFGEIAFSMIDMAAREYVNVKVGLVRQDRRQRCAVPIGHCDQVAVQEGIRRIRFLNFSHSEALGEVVRCLGKRTPRNWGPLSFSGDEDQRYLARRLLQTTGEIGLKALHDVLAKRFIEKVRSCVAKYNDLPHLQDRVAQAVTGISKELTLDYAKEVPILQAGVKKLKAGKSVSRAFLRCLQKSAPNLYAHWNHMAPEERVRSLEDRIDLASSRRVLFNSQRKELLKEGLEPLKRNPAFWLNPWELERWLDQNGYPACKA